MNKLVNRKVADTARLLTADSGRTEARTGVKAVRLDDGRKVYRVLYHDEFDGELCCYEFPRITKFGSDFVSNAHGQIISMFREDGSLSSFIGEDQKEAYRHLYYRYKACVLDEAINDGVDGLGEAIKMVIDDFKIIHDEEAKVLKSIDEVNND